MFDIKAHALMTGQPSEPKRLPKDLREALPPDIAEQKRVYARDLPNEIEDEIWARFQDGIEPLRSSGSSARCSSSTRAGSSRRTSRATRS